MGPSVLQEVVGLDVEPLDALPEPVGFLVVDEVPLEEVTLIAELLLPIRLRRHHMQFFNLIKAGGTLSAWANCEAIEPKVVDIEHAGKIHLDVLWAEEHPDLVPNARRQQLLKTVV